MSSLYLTGGVVLLLCGGGILFLFIIALLFWGLWTNKQTQYNLQRQMASMRSSLGQLRSLIEQDEDGDAENDGGNTDDSVVETLLKEGSKTQTLQPRTCGDPTPSWGDLIIRTESNNQVTNQILPVLSAYSMLRSTPNAYDNFSNSFFIALTNPQLPTTCLRSIQIDADGGGGVTIIQTKKADQPESCITFEYRPEYNLLIAYGERFVASDFPYFAIFSVDKSITSGQITSDFDKWAVNGSPSTGLLTSANDACVYFYTVTEAGQSLLMLANFVCSRTDGQFYLDTFKLDILSETATYQSRKVFSDIGINQISTTVCINEGVVMMVGQEEPPDDLVLQTMSNNTVYIFNAELVPSLTTYARFTFDQYFLARGSALNPYTGSVYSTLDYMIGYVSYWENNLAAYPVFSIFAVPRPGKTGTLVKIRDVAVYGTCSSNDAFQFNISEAVQEMYYFGGSASQEQDTSPNGAVNPSRVRRFVASTVECFDLDPLLLRIPGPPSTTTGVVRKWIVRNPFYSVMNIGHVDLVSKVITVPVRINPEPQPDSVSSILQIEYDPEDRECHPFDLPPLTNSFPDLPVGTVYSDNAGVYVRQRDGWIMNNSTWDPARTLNSSS